MHLCTKQKQTHRHRKQNVWLPKGEGGGTNQEFGINTYTLLYTKQITNEDPLHSPGNYTQYFVITYKRKEYGKIYVCVYIYITESFCCTPETQHCKSTILQF